MYNQHSAEEELVEKLLPYLKNILVTHDGHIAHFCPFCQTHRRRENGKRWSESKRKGYLLLANPDKHQNTVFYCHNDRCSSRSLVDGHKALPLDVYADYILNHCFKDEENNHIPQVYKDSANVAGRCRDWISHLDIDSTSQPALTKLKSSTPQQQSCLGGQLDKRRRDRKSRQKCLWAGYADRKKGKVLT